MTRPGRIRPAPRLASFMERLLANEEARLTLSVTNSLMRGLSSVLHDPRCKVRLGFTQNFKHRLPIRGHHAGVGCTLILAAQNLQQAPPERVLHFFRQ